MTLILDRAAECEEDGSHRHRGVEFRRQANAHRHVVLLLDLAARAQHIVPAVRRRHADIVPQVLAEIDRVRHETVGEAEVLLRLRVIRTLDRQLDRLAMLALAFLVDLAMVDDLLLVHWRRRQEHEQVVPFLRRYLGGGPRGQRGDPHVIDDDLGIVALAPFLHICVVEPLVIARHEVVPLEDLQGVLGCLRAARQHKGAKARGKRGRRGGLDQAAAPRVVANKGAGRSVPARIDDSLDRCNAYVFVHGRLRQQAGSWHARRSRWHAQPHLSSLKDRSCQP